MTEYAVHFQKGRQVGARSFRTVHVEVGTPEAAIKLAKAEFHEPGYRLTRVDHINENYQVVVDR